MNKILRCIMPIVSILLITGSMSRVGASNFQSIAVQSFQAEACISTSPLQNVMLIEGNHILSCQIKDNRFGANALGCINDVVVVDPTWVYPRENGTAVLGLIEAYALTEKEDFKQSALLAADYLKNRQEPDGGWCRWYDEKNNTPVVKDKSPSEAGSAIMAYYKIMSSGWEDSSHQYYASAINAAIYIMDCVDHKPHSAAANGLSGSGKEYVSDGATAQDERGSYRWGSWSWTADNCYAYLGLLCMREWAAMCGDADFAGKCDTYARGILNGINTRLKNPSNPVWYPVVDGDGNTISGFSDRIMAMCYYPQKLDLPIPQYGSADIAQWMTANLQVTDGTIATGKGAFLWGDDNHDTPASRDRRSPGFSMEAYLALSDISGTVSHDSRDLAKEWWEADDNTNSKGAAEFGVTGRNALWDKVRGGFVDWYDPDGTGITSGQYAESHKGFVAYDWLRFIDTSAYAIFAYRGGYDFRMGITPDMPHPALTHAGLQRVSPLANVVVATGTVSDASGLSRVDAYYYKESDTSISTTTAYFPGYPTASNFSCSMPVSGLSSAKSLYYRLAVYDKRGFCTRWPGNDASFYRVSVDANYASTIDSNGGTLSLPNENPNGGTTSLMIPPGALEGATQITITEVNPSDGSSPGLSALALAGQNSPIAVYHFGPDGLVFNNNVQLTISYQDIDHDGIVDGTSYPATSLHIMWWDGTEWRLLGGTVNTQKNTVTCSIRHFSTYGLFPLAAISNADLRPKERIITPALADHINDFAQFGGLDDTDIVNIYDVTGRRVRQLHGNSIWDGKNDANNMVESGLYIYQIKKSGKTISGTIVVAK